MLEFSPDAAVLEQKLEELLLFRLFQLEEKHVCFPVWDLLHGKEHGFVKIEDSSSLALRLVGLLSRLRHVILSPFSLLHYIPCNVILARLISPLKGLEM